MISTSRREFIYKSVSAIMVASMPLSLLTRYALALQVDTRSLKELAEGLQGNLILPEDSEYEDYRVGFNKRYDFHPRVIVLCQNEADVIHCVKWAIQNQITIRIKSGGHSYEDFSSGTGIVLDLREMNDVQVNRDHQSAEIQPGARLEKVYVDLWQYGLGFPGGSCLTVGVGGLALGGGQGFLLRSQGLASDHLTSVRLVSASGELLVADSDSNSDLLWACQGAGAGSFGVVTSLGFDRLLPVDQVTLFKLDWQQSKIIDGFLAWQDWAPSSSMRVSTVWGKGAFEDTATCMGQFLGDPEEFRELAKPVLKDADPQIWKTSFMNGVNFLAGSRGTHPPVYFKTKSDYGVIKLSSQAISNFLKELKKIPAGGDGWVVFESYGGIMDFIPSHATAFPHRKGNLFCVEYNVSWQRAEQSAQMLGWMSEFYRKMRPNFSGAAYANYSDLDLEDWGQAYFGNNFERLKLIKKKYDGKNVFQYAQSIPPAA